jgi:Protein of unknown function (DUF1524)
MVTLGRPVPPADAPRHRTPRGTARRTVRRVAAGRLRTRQLPRRRLLRYALIAVAVAVVVANAVLSQRTVPLPPSGGALEALETLAIREPVPDGGYERELFGEPWADVDVNGCDTRNDVLARDLDHVAYADDRTACVVRSGVLEDPYTGTTIPFVRGVETSAAVQVDHVVALLDAWRKGAASWDSATRERFANDPLNLLASDGPANMSKGARDASAWLPPDATFRCQYVARQVAVKVVYELAVTPSELESMRGVLASCPAEPLPAG